MTARFSASFAAASLLLAHSTPAGAALVLTQRNDNARTGQNTNETVLTLANVNVNSFGRLFTHSVDGNVYAQPLAVTNVAIPGKGIHNVVYVATEHDSVYAFDADSNAGINAGPLWQVSFINSGAGVTTVPTSESNEPNIAPETGITSTPVIDASAATIYLEVRTREVAGGTTNYPHRLHALDIATGLERSNSPVLITAINYPGTGTPGYPDSDGDGHVLFNDLREHSRPGLLLLNGVVYFAYASPGDHEPYHGWVFGYDARTLTQRGAFNTTPNGGLGGIWMAGAGLSADSAGYIYVETGNGTFDPTNQNYGDSVLKLATAAGLSLADYFTPFDQANLDALDLDLGSAGSVVLPDWVGSAGHPHLLVGAGKSGTIYLLDRDNLGQFNASDNNQIVQSVAGAVGVMLSTPAFFNGTLYYAGINDHLKAFTISSGAIIPAPAAIAPTTFGYPGASPSVSADGTNNAIIWALQEDTSHGGQAVLHAYNATNVAQELYNSSQVAARDNPGGTINFNVPTVVNGKVYVGTANSLSVFGAGVFVPAPTLAPNGALFTNSITVNLADALPGAVIYYTLDGSPPTTNSFPYTVPLVLSNSATILAIAVAPGAVDSPAARATFLSIFSMGNGTGLLGEYFSDHFSTNPFSGSATLRRTDGAVNFNWGVGSPDSLISTDHFTARWSGAVQPQFSELYTFYTTADDGVRLWVNNQLLIDKWVTQAATEWSGSLALNAAQTYSLRLEYFENTGLASARLSWSSPSTSKTIIPPSQLYPSTNGPPLFFNSTDYVANGGFQLELSGWSGKSYILQGTTDFWNWVSLSTNRMPAYPLNLSDPWATNFRYRFYRAVSEPGP